MKWPAVRMGEHFRVKHATRVYDYAWARSASGDSFASST